LALTLKKRSDRQWRSASDPTRQESMTSLLNGHERPEAFSINASTDVEPATN
jgi:hypothetical protein